MPRRKVSRDEDEDVISRIADAGENAVRWLVDLPHRTVVEAKDGVEKRLYDIATRLRALDPLDRRVSTLEKRLDSLEKPKQRAARKASPRAKHSGARAEILAKAPVEPEHVEQVRGPEDSRTGEELAENETRHEAERAQTG